MGDHQEPQYSGIDQYPGWLATVITIAISTVFIGALYISATSHHEDPQEPPSEDEEQ